MELIYAMIMLIVMVLCLAGICQIVEWIMDWYDNRIVEWIMDWDDNRKNENKWVE